MKIILLIAATLITFAINSTIFAQGSYTPFDGEVIRSVEVEFVNPGTDTAFIKTLEAKIIRNFYLYPSDKFNRVVVNAYLGKVRRLSEVANVDYEVSPAESGGLILTLIIEVRRGADSKFRNFGVLSSGRLKDFPVLFQSSNAILEATIKTGQMFYSNINSWYGRPDAMLAGNPLVEGTPPGNGFSGWYEAYVSAGLYTMFPVVKPVYLFGGASIISSWKFGRDLFTQPNNTYSALEDAFGGVFAGYRTSGGNQIRFLLQSGRYQTSIADGMLIKNTSSNGSYKSALQLNPRWATDLTHQLTFAYNRNRIQFFQIDPDEFSQIDTRTLIRLVNAELGENSKNQIGLTYATVPRSEFSYYTENSVLKREGLWVADIRYYHLPLPGTNGLVFKSELARQFHKDFDMNAWGGYAEIGWSFTEQKYSPYITFRHSIFTGDDPKTSAFERWDPLLSGGNGEEWVQGANHFKVVQISNVVAERLQLKLRPMSSMETVTQFWLFRAYDLNNLGGNPALSFLQDKDYGFEINTTVKYFPDKNWYFHAHLAFTDPGKAVRNSLNDDLSSWWSFMAFFTYSM
jgi:hypothetical protein